MTSPRWFANLSNRARPKLCAADAFAFHRSGPRTHGGGKCTHIVNVLARKTHDLPGPDGAHDGVHLGFVHRGGQVDTVHPHADVRLAKQLRELNVGAEGLAELLARSRDDAGLELGRRGSGVRPAHHVGAQGGKPVVRGLHARARQPGLHRAVRGQETKTDCAACGLTLRLQMR